jgi:hypothetical protein
MRRIQVPGGRRAAILVAMTGLLLGLGGCYYHHPGAYGYGGGHGYRSGGYGFHDGRGYGKHGYKRYRGRYRGHGYGHGHGSRYYRD